MGIYWVPIEIFYKGNSFFLACACVANAIIGDWFSQVLTHHLCSASSTETDLWLDFFQK